MVMYAVAIAIYFLLNAVFPLKIIAGHIRFTAIETYFHTCQIAIAYIRSYNIINSYSANKKPLNDCQLTHTLFAYAWARPNNDALGLF